MSKSTYTKPTLRERIKNRILAGTKGGNAGEWSARKAQLLANEYKKSGGDYSKKKTTDQKNLTKWTKEEWMTRSQYATGKSDKAITDKYTKRYLPKNAWKKLDPNEQVSTDVKKRIASKSGQQFVSNTQRAKTASKKVRNK